MRNRINWPVLVLLTVIAGMVGYSTSAQKSPAPAAPSIVATVNIEAVFRGLTERSTADATLTQLAEELDARGMRDREQIELLKQDLDLYSPESKQYQDTATKVAQMGYRLQAYREFAVRKLEVEKTRTLRALYAKIKSSIGELSRRQGYDVVFVNDTVVELPTDVTEAETWRQISARRMLYTNPQLDITQQILEYMNDAYKVAQGR
jgi:Skp family chaperone for outer membrane proteins